MTAGAVVTGSCVICSFVAVGNFTLPSGLRVALCRVHEPNSMNAQEILSLIEEAMAE